MAQEKHHEVDSIKQTRNFKEIITWKSTCHSSILGHSPIRIISFYAVPFEIRFPFTMEKNFLATFDWRVDSKGVKPAKDESPFEAAY